MAVLLIIGGTAYVCIELIWRGHSDISMAVLGAISFVLIGNINESLPWELPFWIQCLIGTGMIVVLEFVSGCILNLWLHLGIWDYSSMPLNLLGQICLPFTIGWFFLSAVAIVLDDYLRYFLFGEEKPRYYMWFQKKG